MLNFIASLLSSAARLQLANAKAVLTLGPYELLRPFLRWAGRLRGAPTGDWVFGGHGGRLYEDNAASLHRLALRSGQRAIWITGDRTLARRLEAEGIPVLRRNSFRARVAFENAEVLVYSHGITDLDHAMWWVRVPRGLKVHLNHCLNLLKGERIAQASDKAPRRGRRDPFDVLLASSPRELRNFASSPLGRERDIVLGGGAHLDAFFTARGVPPERTIVYFPTFRETPATRRALDDTIAALVNDRRLHDYLDAEDYTLFVVDHVNTQDRRSHSRRADHPRVRFIEADSLLGCMLSSALLISDYSGVLCDYLALDRPVVFFPFDREDYLQRRRLYVDYDEFAYGRMASSVAELVEVITGNAWRDLAPYVEHRRRWQAEFFPSMKPDYAQRSLETIRALVARRDERRSPGGELRREARCID